MSYNKNYSLVQIMREFITGTGTGTGTSMGICNSSRDSQRPCRDPNFSKIGIGMSMGSEFPLVSYRNLVEGSIWF